MDKQIKTKLKELRNMMTYQYNNIYSMLKGGYITNEDIDIYVNNYPDIIKILNKQKEKKEEEQKQNNFKAIVNMMKPTAEKYLEQLKAEKLLVGEELNKTLLVEAFTLNQISNKNNRVSRLKKKLEEIERVIKSLQIALAEESPKRKVGRPKKNTQQENSEVDYEDIDEED